MNDLLSFDIWFMPSQRSFMPKEEKFLKSFRKWLFCNLKLTTDGQMKGLTTDMLSLQKYNNSLIWSIIHRLSIGNKCNDMFTSTHNQINHRSFPHWFPPHSPTNSLHCSFTPSLPPFLPSSLPPYLSPCLAILTCHYPCLAILTHSPC